MRLRVLIIVLLITGTAALSACGENAQTTLPTAAVTTSPALPSPSPSDTTAKTIKPSPSPSHKPAEETLKTALRNLKEGWREEIVYENPLVNPSGMAVTGDGSILVFSRGNNRILTLTAGGSFEQYLDTGSLPGIGCIGYQPGHGRLLIINQVGGLFAAGSGQLEALKSFGVLASTMAVDSRDDSFYGAAFMPNGALSYYDADGNLIDKIASGLESCSQVVLDESTDTLYYSEAFAGRITALDLADKSTRIIATGVGIPGTSEPIALGFDNNQRLYYFTANQGLHRYENGQFRKVMDSVSGVGMMLWSSDHNAFLVGNGAGSNIIAYDPVTAEARHITPYFNAWGIVEMNDAAVLIAANMIYKVTESGLVPFVADMPAPCHHLERDDDGNIYAGTADGRLWRVTPEGTLEPWGAGFTDWEIVSLNYDTKNDLMVAVCANHFQSVAEVWRIPMNAPDAPVKVMQFSGVRVTPHLPLATVDDNGNIYVIERQRNVIYRIPDGATAAEVFISNVLENEAITVPGLEYSSREHALVVSTIENYELWPLDTLEKEVLAVNNGSVDNFAVNEGTGGCLVMIQSGRVIRLIPAP